MKKNHESIETTLKYLKKEKNHKSIETTLKYLMGNEEGAELSIILNRLETIADALETGQWTKEDAISALRELR